MYCSIIEDARKETEQTFPNECPKAELYYHTEICIVVETVTFISCGLLQYFLERLSQDRALYSVALHTACVIALDVSITTMIHYLVKNCKGLQYTASNMIDSREGRC